MLPRVRKDEGLLLGRSISDNITLPHLATFQRGWSCDAGRSGATVDALVADARGPRDRSAAAAVSSLSGGNQQKVLFAKWLLGAPRVLLADEPTRGVDVGAKRAIYELIVSLAADGMALLLVSSEIEEVLGLAHRVLVMRAARSSASSPARPRRRTRSCAPRSPREAVEPRMSRRAAVSRRRSALRGARPHRAALRDYGIALSFVRCSSR